MNIEIVQGSYAVCTVESVVEQKGYLFATWHGGKTFLHIRQGRSIVVTEGRIVFGDEMMPLPPVGAKLIAVIDVDEQQRYIATVWGAEKEYLECLEWVRHNSIRVQAASKEESVKAPTLPKPAPAVQIPTTPETKRKVNVPRRTPRIQGGKVVQFPQDMTPGKAMEAESGEEKTAS